MKLKLKKLLLSMAVGIAYPCLASAQNPQPAPPQQPHPTVAPPTASTPPPEQIAPPDGNVPGSMSKKLSQTQGTLKPPAVDPGIQAPMPPHAQGTMPVIPPPGSPGGNPKVVPK
jgi:hypothetical protein